MTYDNIATSIAGLIINYVEQSNIESNLYISGVNIYCTKSTMVAQGLAVCANGKLKLCSKRQKPNCNKTCIFKIDFNIVL